MFSFPRATRQRQPTARTSRAAALTTNIIDAQRIAEADWIKHMTQTTTAP